jgi:hypothetical protein
MCRSRKCRRNRPRRRTRCWPEPQIFREGRLTNSDALFVFVVADVSSAVEGARPAARKERWRRKEVPELFKPMGVCERFLRRAGRTGSTAGRMPAATVPRRECAKVNMKCFGRAVHGQKRRSTAAVQTLREVWWFPVVAPVSGVLALALLWNRTVLPQKLRRYFLPSAPGINKPCRVKRGSSPMPATR